MASAASRFLRLAGGAWLVALAIGLIRAVRPRHKAPAAGADSQLPPDERPDPPPRQGPVRFKDQPDCDAEPGAAAADAPDDGAGPAAATAGPGPQGDPEPTEITATDESTPRDAPAQLWAAPIGGECPAGFPLKAAAGSQIFHEPGGAFYERTVPERCYATPADAEADGLRAAKR